MIMVVGCVDHEFDEPPATGEDPTIPETDIVSLEEVQAKYVPGEYIKLDINKYVKAIVVADDESGNFFRQIIIEDENSDLGINLLIDDVELYNTYPVGRRVFVDLTDLYIGDYNGLPQLGAAPYDDGGDLRLAGIQSELAKNEVVLPGQYGLEVIPRIKKINELTANDYNTLVQISEVQFKPSALGQTLAISDPPTGVNLDLADCEGNEIIVRTSGYSDLATEDVPGLNGTITAVYGVFGSDKQLLVRTLEDFNFENPRCEVPSISISTIRSNYSQGASSAPQGVIMGVVTSDYTTDNVNSRNLFLQDESAGILVRFTGNHSFPLGAKLMIDVSGMELSEFRDLLQINNVPLSNVENLGDGELPEPQEVSISDILSGFSDYESELVLIKGASITGGNTFSGGLDVNDGTGTIEMFTQFGATFADDPVPAGPVDIMAIVSIYDDPQIIINSPEDAGGTSGGGGSGNVSNISELRNAFTGSTTTAPNGSIKGVVISDRSNGNINSRNLVIQDENAGIVIRFEDNHSYDLGEELEIDVSGEELSEYNGLLQVNNLPLANASSNGMGTSPSPVEVTVNTLLNNIEDYESQLVSLIGVTLSGNSVYSGNVDISDNTGTIQMYTSSGADFADESLPEGELDIIAIASQFNDPQVIIRNLDDVGEGTGGGGGSGDLTLMSLRDAFESGSGSAPSGTITGVVISDYATENTHPRNLHIQDASGGITLRFDDEHNIPMGKQITVEVSGLELSEYEGLLQVNNIPNSNVLEEVDGVLPEPQLLTIADVIADLENLESTLVRINNVTFDSGTFSGSVDLSDSSGNITAFIRSQASFVDSATPTGEVDIIGIVTQFNDAQITFRNLNDIIE